MAIRRVRASSLAVAVCGLAAWAALSRHLPAARAQAAQQGTRPNVVIVLVDDMGWSDTGPFGSEIATPNLNRLAAGGRSHTVVVRHGLATERGDLVDHVLCG